MPEIGTSRAMARHGGTRIHKKCYSIYTHLQGISAQVKSAIVSHLVCSWHALERGRRHHAGPPLGYLVGGPNPKYSMDKLAAFAVCLDSHAPPRGLNWTPDLGPLAKV
jgi:hypothetical protein